MNLKKGKIILPSTLTSFSLVLGFLAIIICLTTELVAANRIFTYIAGCWMVVFASLLDGLDGKVARLTKTTSEFGIQYDSMADLVTFGVAPAVILYHHFLIDQDPVYLIFPVIFVLSSAIRLSRFNVSANQQAKKFNVGLPMPVSGGMICAAILFLNYLKGCGVINGGEHFLLPAMMILTMYFCSQMISTVKYDLTFHFWFRCNPIRPLRYGIVLGFIGVLIFVDPAVFFFGIGAYYISYCSLRHLYFRSHGNRLEAYGDSVTEADGLSDSPNLK